MLLSRVIHQHQAKSNLLLILRCSHTNPEKQSHLWNNMALIWLCTALIFVKYSHSVSNIMWKSTCVAATLQSITAVSFFIFYPFCLGSFLHRLFPPCPPVWPPILCLNPSCQTNKISPFRSFFCQTAGIEPSDSHTSPPLSTVSLFCLTASYFSHWLAPIHSFSFAFSYVDQYGEQLSKCSNARYCTSNVYQ